MNIQTGTRQIGSWVVREYNPTGEGLHPVLLLVHGWTGDENVMWIFTQRISTKFLVIAPRGLFPAPEGGFGWHAHRDTIWPDYKELQPAVEQLCDFLNPENFPSADFSRLAAIGFSQGAALLYTAILLHPERFQVVAGLSGFLPSGLDPLVKARPLNGKSIFVAHGIQDEIIPVEKARQAVEDLERAGAKVAYCEEAVGHKLSAGCFRSMEMFLEIQDF